MVFVVALVGMIFVGILFGGMAMKILEDVREIRIMKEQNRRLSSGEINQIDFISYLTKYENDVRAAQNRERVMQEWCENCKAEKEADAEKASRARQKKQIAEQLAKAKEATV